MDRRVFSLDTIDEVEHSRLHDSGRASARDGVGPACDGRGQHDFVPVRNHVVSVQHAGYREHQNGKDHGKADCTISVEMHLPTSHGAFSCADWRAFFLQSTICITSRARASPFPQREGWTNGGPASSYKAIQS